MIRLNEDYTIEPDTYGWALIRSEHREPENGTPYIFQEKWYFATIEQCLKKFIDSELKSEESINAVLDKLNELHETLKALCPRIFIVDGKIKILEDAD